MKPPHLHPLGDFKPADQWQTHVNALFYGIQGPGIHDHFQTYVSRDYRLAHALAEEFFQQITGAEKVPDTVHLQEWGVGNGNLAARFLDHLKCIDAANRVYPRVRYRLCDYSEITYEEIETRGGIQWGGERLYADGKFQTDSGKAKLWSVDPTPMPEETNEKYPFLLNTGRTVEHWHTRTKTGGIERRIGR